LKLLDAIGVPVIGLAGFEADDVMATLVTRLRARRPDVLIRLVSKDKDLKQLLADKPRGEGEASAVTPTVELFDIHTDTAFSSATLMAETGLKPEQIVDMLTLMGDTVDNVPGVEGVGEKTAALLLKEFGTLDGVIANANTIKGKRGEKIREAIPRLALSKQLVSLVHDVPVEFDVERARVDRLRLDALIPILRELGFNRYQDEVRSLIVARGGSVGELDAKGTRENVAARDAVNVAASEAATSSALFAQKPGKAGAGAGAGTGAGAGERSTRTKASDRDSAPGLFDALPWGGSIDDDGVLVVARQTGERQKGESQMDGSAAFSPTFRAAQSGVYTCVRARGQLEAVAEEIKAWADAGGVIAFDTETTSLSFLDAKLCGISLAIEPGRAWYVPMRSPTPEEHLGEAEVLGVLGPILADAKIAKCGHNLKYDMLVLRRAGVMVRGLWAVGACDTMVASYLIDASRSSHSLDALSLALLGRTNISISELIGSGKAQRTFDTVPVEFATQYAAEDADATLQLYHEMMPQIREMGLLPLLQGVEMPLVEVLAELEWNGITVDGAELDRQRARLQQRIDDIVAKLAAFWHKSLQRRVDPDSPKQLASALFGKPDDDPPGLGLPAVKKTKTGYSTDAEVLEQLAQDPEVSAKCLAPEMVLEYRQLSKLVSTYLVALKDSIHASTGRVHTSFHQTVAATGRLASSDPNLQNIPIRTDVGREIRRAFVAPVGHTLITADYSQIELRILAHLSRDPALIDAFHKGQDIHTAVAAQIHGIDASLVTREQRAGAKMVNFGIVYGITPYGLARRLKVGDREAAAIIDAYKRKFAGITTFLQECVEQARSKGFVETILKRRRPIPDVDSKQQSRRALAERLAINSVVQGSAADLIKLAMVHVHRDLVRARGESAGVYNSGHGNSGHGNAGVNAGVNAASEWEAGAYIDASPDQLMCLGGTRMLLQIHDELVLESPIQDAAKAIAHVTWRMQSAMQLSVPLVADSHIGVTWFDGK